MKTTWKKWGLILTSVFIFGFDGNDMVELEGYVNARASANFVKSANNVKFVLPPKTRGKILESQTLPSGNTALQVEVADGPRRGEKVWVYFNKGNPAMKLFKSEDAKSEETKEIKNAKSVETQRETAALKVPEPPKAAAGAPEAAKAVVKESKEVAKDSKEKVSAAEAFRKIELGNKAVQKNKPCDDCEVAKAYTRPTSKAPEPEAKPAPAPKKELAQVSPKEATFSKNVVQDRPAIIGGITRTTNPYPVALDWQDGLSLGDRNSYGYQVGRRGRTGPIEGFRIKNGGPNKVTPGNGTDFRSWEFFHVGNARQDLSFYVRDSFDKSDSATTESLMMVFPRNTLPQVRTVGEKVITTLANGETVTFNKKTQEVIGGVFSENAGVAKSTAPRVEYNGKGLLVRLDSQSGKDAINSGKTATITKQGKTCKVPAGDLWPKSSGGHFKFFSDNDFETYLRSKCGFGMGN
jgi:hypothetical protein